MPEFTDLTDLTNEVTNIARDAAYVVIGLGVLGFQRAQVQRVELKSKLAADLGLEERLAEVRSTVTSGVQAVDGIVESAIQFVETSLGPIEEQLPSPARELAKKAHEQAREVRTQIRELVTSAA
jgi:hypothetical protein